MYSKFGMQINPRQSKSVHFHKKNSLVSAKNLLLLIYDLVCLAISYIIYINTHLYLRCVFVCMCVIMCMCVIVGQNHMDTSEYIYIDYDNKKS